MLKRMLFLFLILTAASFVYAQTEQPPAQNQNADPVATAADQNLQVVGTISKIDHDKMTFTVKDDSTKETRELKFTSSTAFTKNGSTITHSELKKGDHVSLEVDSQNNAVKIDVTAKEEGSKQ